MDLQQPLYNHELLTHLAGALEGDFLPQSSVAVSMSLVILEMLETVTLTSSQKTRRTEGSVYFTEIL